ncbi:Adenosylmethionine-8-amino-7-oxononanoate aminotransferase [Aliiroseovarius sediminilitoris]|uniref:Adenosylmethionine-8-amino-7-oxononanoate aminotransferase n=1 Tax=Aliiroseovarius sediminilitoris TaxID=1173584 RepID=A0A1I0QH68_9RHOB|nr:aminotransferase [Aliiroseovarius sediminilitoris]SEW26490.1 Adenosylmethionine-8-amino-7-oxononanoate aminotransferase [Aliiroseovarius sediminilitoris]
MATQDANSAWAKDKAHVLHPYTDFASFKDEGSQVITGAKGMYVTDSDGNRLLDAIAGLWCVNIGHGRREMADAISDQVMQMQYYNPFGHSTNEPAAELGAWLASHAPGDLNHVYYTTGGSTANDAAIRLVHYYFTMKGQHRKKKIISRNDAYHGATYVAAELTGIHATKMSFDKVGEHFINHVSAANMYAKPDDVSEEAYCDYLVREFENRIEQLGPDNVAAFIAEPVMGAGGVLIAPNGYHRRMWEVCKRHDILYIADEVVTAFGRLGHWFASEDVFDYQPDILVSAKGITSGYVPLGVTLISDEIYDVISRPQCEGGVFSMGLTYFGHPLACRAALTNVEIIEREGLLGHARMMADHFQSSAQRLKSLDHIGDVRGHGLMLAIELVEDKASKKAFPITKQAGANVFKNCVDEGVIVRPVGDKIILSPPLVINEEEIGKIFSVLGRAISSI